MDSDNKTIENKTCNCGRIPVIAHELTQSLLIIYSYIKGCDERIKHNSLDLKLFSKTLQKINNQIHIMGHKIHELF